MQQNKDTTGKSDLARKQAGRKLNKQNNQVTSNIPSVPSSFNSGKGLNKRNAPALRAAETAGNNPAGPMRGYQTTNRNPYQKASGGATVAATPNRNYVGKPKK